MWCAIAIIFLLLLRIEMMHVIYPMCNLLVEAPSLSTWVEHDPCTTAVPVAISPFCFKRPFQKPSRSCFFQASFSAFFFWNWRKESWKGKPGTRERDRVLLCIYRITFRMVIITHVFLQWFLARLQEKGRVQLMIKSWVGIFVTDVRYHQFRLNHPLESSSSSTWHTIDHHFLPLSMSRLIPFPHPS